MRCSGTGSANARRVVCGVSAFPQVEVLAGAADSIPLPKTSVDAIVCAQSFHWFATPEALTEIYHVLKPGGRLGLVWNWRNRQVSWVAQLDDILNRFAGDTPRYYTGLWREAFPFQGFGPLQEQHFYHAHIGSPEDVIIKNVRSYSFIAALAPEERKKIDGEVSALIAAEPELNGKNVVTVPYETAAFHSVKVIA